MLGTISEPSSLGRRRTRLTARARRNNSRRSQYARSPSRDVPPTPQQHQQHAPHPQRFLQCRVHPTNSRAAPSPAVRVLSQTNYPKRPSRSPSTTLLSGMAMTTTTTHTPLVRTRTPTRTRTATRWSRSLSIPFARVSARAAHGGLQTRLSFLPRLRRRARAKAVRARMRERFGEGGQHGYLDRY